MKYLSRQEELLLLSILKLKADAYGVMIRKHVSKETGKYWSIGAIYDVLDRLTRKKFLSTSVSNPIKVRGGKSRRYYQVTVRGLKALDEVRNLQKKTWANLPEYAREKK